ncbi:hypothetical protein C4D60_Mb06t16140 [Musa balbisiana]|uniref:Uncharacterized protein n=1 Tax=Musa balbisiana TaxID=52838 RepID=A0A4S8IPN9_MUSBA|nr:hypothetical protein C4D60_Mb06t16140 [Musa balbisiana]
MTGGGITWPNGGGDVMRYRQLLRRRRPPARLFRTSNPCRNPKARSDLSSPSLSSHPEKERFSDPETMSKHLPRF